MSKKVDAVALIKTGASLAGLWIVSYIVKEYLTHKGILPPKTI